MLWRWVASICSVDSQGLAGGQTGLVVAVVWLPSGRPFARFIGVVDGWFGRRWQGW